ncbi:hypothetical protein SB2_25535 [Methylobacterium radiotolerans]|nr:hypothetical protein SB3_28260 [Methylobacterium radiotolerans]KTS44100.1 hypothetical protein SB2_25535 [Methylobacterium radiotolerans]
MSAFRTEAVYGSRTIRVFHVDYLPRAVACICPAEGTAVDLVPILYDRAPSPLTGREQRFDTLEMALAYLGIEQHAEAQAA